jgi:transcription elongation factor Elf1
VITKEKTRVVKRATKTQRLEAVMLERDYSFSCPYCGKNLSIRLDATGGRHQNFVSDCEICCRPIEITIEFEYDEVVGFTAETDD